MDRLTLEQGQAAIAAATGGRLAPEYVPAAQSNGRILARHVFAASAQPPFNRSPLDGYALRAADSEGASLDHPAVLRVAGAIFAGMAASPLPEGCAVRVTTGAMLPAEADCVIRQEDTDRGMETVRLYRALRPRQNYCFAGEDFEKGALLAKRGERLDAVTAAILASGGNAGIPVVRRPRAALLSTGDELVRPGGVLTPGRIYDSNACFLQARLEELGAMASPLRHIPDQAERLAEALDQAASGADCVLTTGGVSVGTRDLIPEALARLDARIVFHGLDFKPGSVTLFAVYAGKPVLCLSGNPFAAAVGFELLGRVMLSALTGSTELLPQRGTAETENAFPKASPGRRLIRARFHNGKIRIPDKHDSGLLFSMRKCGCLADIPAGSEGLRAGQPVSVFFL